MPTHWADIQEQVFLRWTNDELKTRGLTVHSTEGLRSGVALCTLLEVISGKAMPRWNTHPRTPAAKIENCSMAVEFIKAQGLRLENIGGPDIAEGNKRLILGLLWTLILRFEIQRGGSVDLIKWVQEKLPQLNITGWTGKDWNSGVALCALCETIKKGSCPEFSTLNSADKLKNAELGLSRAELLGVDRLILANELVNPKVDALALQTYIAQFRNIPHSLGDAQRLRATGVGLHDGIVNQPSNFSVFIPSDLNGKLTVFVEGPKDKAPVVMTKTSNGYDCSYTPKVAGKFVVHAMYESIHIPGSPFLVTVLEEESLGGEGKIRVFISSTSSSTKGHADIQGLTRLFESKKVHLRADFEAFHLIDLFEREDREAIFRKAGTRALPIVFVDDKYVGDFDRVQKLEEDGKLDDILAMKGVKLISVEEHMNRMKLLSADSIKVSQLESKPVFKASQNKPVAVASFLQPAVHVSNRATSDVPLKTVVAVPSKASVSTPVSAPAGPKFCGNCGTARTNFTAKFCSDCGGKF